MLENSTTLKYAGQPVKLANNALDSLKAIDQHHKASSDPEVLDQIESITKIAESMMVKKSPIRVLNEILRFVRCNRP